MARLLQSRRSLLLLAACLLAAVGLVPAGGAAVGALPTPVPTVSDYQFLSSSTTPPTQAECNSAIPVARRCFTPTSMRNSYNVSPLIAAGKDGRGQTIAIIDSFGNPNMASDLKVFNDAMGTPHMCGEPGASCAAGTPTFQHVYWNGKTMVKAPPAGAQNPGIQTRNIWALEVALDVEWAHAIAPGANILNITTNPAETLGVQGFPAMMNAEQYVVDHDLANVISQSFASAEEAFASTQALQNLRHAFVSAAANGVTVLGSSGDGGTANSSFTPVPTQPVFPFPTVEWPASDPLVTGVGGTYLCTNAVTGQGVDNTSPPVDCQNQPNREKGWIASGGGFSHVFGKPGFQNTLPAGTSSGCPQWAALVAIADQIAGHGLGMINPALYALAKGPNYGTYFYDVTTGNNQANPAVMGYPATTGWDPVTGLGTPNAANLLPALAAG